MHVSDTVTGPWTTNVQPPIVTDDGNGLTETVRIRDSSPMTDADSRFHLLHETGNHAFLNSTYNISSSLIEVSTLLRADSKRSGFFKAKSPYNFNAFS